ncbi:hypothetical protein [Treponema pectinovorum]|uniref:hypothetical protein n=1 Tax=Treponema pectinovorum TaxID=164 RepID=UPI0011C8E96B|nr:hypothetical protein [Treponema pectinovorum]
MNDNEKEVIEFWKFLEILQTKNFNPQKDEKENKSRKCKVLKNTYDLEKLKRENKNNSGYDFCCYSINKSIIEEYFIKEKSIDEKQLKIVKQELKKSDSNITLEYLCRIKYGDINEQAKVQTERPPNLSEKYDIEREKLFCKAINLQKAFVLTSTCLSQNLSILRKCFIPPENKEERLSEIQK